MCEVGKRPSGGFTLIEIMIVVLLIAILLLIAAPNFGRAREQTRLKACISNLKALDAAKEQYAMENRKRDGVSVNWNNLVPSYLKARPSCPAGGTYRVRRVGRNPTCSRSGHSL